MRILLDECVPESVAILIKHHDVRHVSEMGWRGLKNGQLLSMADSLFDILLTTDQNLPYQQNLSKYSIAVLIIASRTNKHEDIETLIPEALKVIPTMTPGQVVRLPIQHD